MTYSIVQADALEFLRSQPSNSLDLVFTSPPYTDARLYLENGKNLGISRKTDDWVLWLADVWVEAQAACKGLVAMVVAGQTKGYRWSAGPALLIAELHRRRLNLRNPPIFHRVGIPGSGGPDWLRADYEWIVCTSRPGKLPWSDNTICGHPPKFAPGGAPSHRTQDGRRVTTLEMHRPNGTKEIQHYQPPEKANPGNVISIPVGGGLLGGDKYTTQNEAPFPEKLASFFVLSFCPPGGTVADVFSGSGTTAAVSVRYGRNFVGCDLRKSQVDLSLRRVREETPMMFV